MLTSIRRITPVPALLIGLVLAACGITHHLAHGVRSAETKAECVTSSRSWEHHRGLGKLHALTRALRAVGHADGAVGPANFSTASVNAIKSADRRLMASISALRNDLPPSCLTGVDARLKRALADFSAGVRSQEAAVTAIERKDTRAAHTAFLAVAAHFRAGGKLFTAISHAFADYHV